MTILHKSSGAACSAFMLELVTGTEVRGGYSIIGIKPLMFCNDGKPQRKDWTPFVSRAGLRHRYPLHVDSMDNSNIPTAGREGKAAHPQ